MAWLPMMCKKVVERHMAHCCVHESINLTLLLRPALLPAASCLLGAAALLFVLVVGVGELNRLWGWPMTKTKIQT